MRLIDADALIDKCGGWYVEEGTESGFIGTLKNLLATMPTIQPVATDTNVGDKISKFIDGLEEIFADLRERHVDDSVCGLCEYDGAYMGQSGDWCNECPGFDRDDCFKLSDKTRKKWTDEIIKALSTVQSQSTTGQLNDGAQSTAQSTNLIDRQATIDAVNNAFDRETLLTGFVRSIALRVIRDMPSAQPEPAIPLSWIENEIKWLKSLDNTFSEITALQISVMVHKWGDEQNETD